MKATTNQSTGAPKRACLLAASAAIILCCGTSCGGLGITKKSGSGEDPQIGEEEPQERRGGIFAKAKRKNSWIDEDIQTTRRERIAAQNKVDFGTTPSPAPATPEPDPDPASSTLELDPDPALTSIPTTPVPEPEPEQPLRLPSLDDDRSESENPATTKRIPDVDSEGYTPLQPKLPGAEPIEPPSD